MRILGDPALNAGLPRQGWACGRSADHDNGHAIHADQDDWRTHHRWLWMQWQPTCNRPGTSGAYLIEGLVPARGPALPPAGPRQMRCPDRHVRPGRAVTPQQTRTAPVPPVLSGMTGPPRACRAARDWACRTSEVYLRTRPAWPKSRLQSRAGTRDVCDVVMHAGQLAVFVETVREVVDEQFPHWRGAAGQEIAALTSSVTFFSTTALHFLSAYVTGHTSPSSRFAMSWKPRVE